MKLFYITNSRIPTEKANGIQIAKMCEAFALENIDTTLVVPRKNNPNLEGINIFEYYDVKNNFTFTELQGPDPHFLIPLPYGIYTKIQGLFFIRTLLKYLRKQNIKKEDVLYIRQEYLIPPLLKKTNQIVWEAHSLPKRRKEYVKYWNQCKKIIAISNGLKSDLVELGVDADKVVVARDGVDLKNIKFQISDFRLKDGLKLQEDSKIVMYTGHLYEWKGADILLEASKLLATSHSPLTTIFVGGTDRDIAQFKKKAGGVENVHILGHKPHADIPKYLKSADVLVLPNSAKSEISRKHTSPMKLFEYMAAGVPIVSSDLESIREVLNKENAVLVDPDDPEALVEGIQKVLKNAEISSKLAKQAQKDVQQYTWKNRAQKIISNIIPPPGRGLISWRQEIRGGG